MNLNISLNISAEELQKQFQETIKDRYETMARRQILSYFYEKNSHTGYSSVDGDGTKFVKSLIDDLLLNEKLQQKMKNFIEKHFDRILEEAAIRAMTNKAIELPLPEGRGFYT
jgi:hypothetical protein